MIIYLIRFMPLPQNLFRIDVLRTIEDVLVVPKWKNVVLKEMRALEKNDTWSLVELPQDKSVVGCKWVFPIKVRLDGLIERYEARLVAKGFTQTYSIYTETFSPITKLNTIRVLLSLTTNLDSPLYQLDVKNALLNGELEEEVYISLPPDFEEDKKGKMVCKPKKSLYGLKQSLRAWFERFSKVIKSHEY